jgi:hypothetical protein
MCRPLSQALRRDPQFHYLNQFERALGKKSLLQTLNVPAHLTQQVT